MGVEIEAAALSSRGAGEGRQRIVANDQRAAFKLQERNGPRRSCGWRDDETADAH